MELTAILEGLLVDGGDLSAQRAARIKSLGKKLKRTLGETSFALDELIESLAIRALGIADGSIQPVAPIKRGSSAWHEAPTEVVAEQAITQPETPAVKDEAAQRIGGKKDFHEQPTVIIDSVTEAALSAADPQSARTTVIDAAAISDELLTADFSDDDMFAAAERAAELARQKRLAETKPAAEEAAAAIQAVKAARAAELAAAQAAQAPSPEGTGPIPDEEATPGWTRPAELLFDDALRLFRLGDSDGALISLERLLASTDLNDDLSEFIRVNEERLLDLYHAIIGPWEKVPVRITENDEPMPLSFFKVPKISVVLKHINGRLSMADIMAKNTMSRLETVAVISQLLRAKCITTEESL